MPTPDDFAEAGNFADHVDALAAKHRADVAKLADRYMGAYPREWWFQWTGSGWVLNSRPVTDADD